MSTETPYQRVTVEKYKSIVESFGIDPAFGLYVDALEPEEQPEGAKKKCEACLLGTLIVAHENADTFEKLVELEPRNFRDAGDEDYFWEMKCLSRKLSEYPVNYLAGLEVGYEERPYDELHEYAEWLDENGQKVEIDRGSKDYNLGIDDGAAIRAHVNAEREREYEARWARRLAGVTG